MNIFVLDNNPQLAVQYHCDKHVVKMITEYAQILSSVLRLNGTDVGYKITHKHHPCTVWAGKSLSNWEWLQRFGVLLYEEYRHRYGEHKTHKAGELILTLPKPNIPDIGLTEFAQAMPDEYKNKNVVEAYRAYYNGDKQHILQYTKREYPTWLKLEN